MRLSLLAVIATVRKVFALNWLMLIRDLAWVMGAADPTSGTVSIHEVVRGFGALLKNGWKPLRNVVFASWDAEEVRTGRDLSPLH